MACSGLLLVGFLLSHVGGNALLLAQDDGASYDEYAQRLRDLGPLLWVARIGLTTLFVVHISLGIYLAVQNRRARGSRYQRPTQWNQRTLSSGSMLLTGLAVFFFLLAHLSHFSFDSRFAEEGASFVRQVLARGSSVLLYSAGTVFLWVHLWHALPSALQSLGLSHPRWSVLTRTLGRGLASLIGLLFLVITVVTYFQ